MKLLELTLDNFKSTRHFDFAPHGNDADIYGDNATGKTTIADAYFWLLFGKDSAGKSDFDLLPMDKDGNIKDGLEASVTGKFENSSGETFTLRRAYHQVFTRKHGETERKLTGNTTDFFVNDVPKPQKEYQAYIAGLCDEQTFRLLTDPDMFPRKMNWSDRRDVLINAFAPDIDDRQIINAHEELKPLINYIGYKSVDEYAEITKARRKKINEQLKEIPGRIDEAEKAKPADMPAENDGPAMLRLQKTKIKLESEISAVRNGESASVLKKQIADMHAKTAQASAEYSRKMSAGNAGLEASAAQLRASISKLQTAILRAKAAISGNTNMAQNLADEMDELRHKCIDTANVEFDASNNICPTCGQEYPPDKQKQIQDDFNGNKANKLEKLEAKGKSLKATKEDLENDAEKQKRQLQADTELLKGFESQLDSLMKQYVEPTPFEETEDYGKYRQQMATTQKQLNIILESSEKRISELKNQLDGATDELDSIKKRALNKGIVENQDKRIEDLRKKETELSQLLATYDNGLMLAEKFTQQKAEDIQKKVNSAFKKVEWKLFDVQVNGGIKPCCEATVGGVQYGNSLNSAAKLNAGLDIINTLGHVYGKSVPVWIDNAESVTKYLQISSQVIYLRVSAEDKALRVEVYENE